MGIEAIIGLVTSIINRAFPDVTEQKKLEIAKELQLSLAELEVAKSQLEVNAKEAESSSLFVSGARPFILWVCGMSFAWQFLVQPVLAFLLPLYTGHAVLLPVFDYASLNTVLFGMLGLGAMRSFDKFKGTAKK